MNLWQSNVWTNDTEWWWGKVKPGYGIDQFGTWSSERNKNPVGKEGLPGWHL